MFHVLVVAFAPSLSPARSRLFEPPRLEPLDIAQRSSVVRVPNFLSADDISQLHAAAGQVESDKGRHDLQQRQGAPAGSWHTVFVNDRLVDLLPDLHSRMFAAARQADADNWQLLDPARHELSFRVCEYHTVTQSGGIPMDKVVSDEYSVAYLHAR